MSRSFREIEKEAIDVRVPTDVALAFRTEALRQGRSVSELGSELIIKHLGMNPKDYGIVSRKRESVA